MAMAEKPTPEDRFEAYLDFGADAIALVLLAAMLAFLCYVWKTMGLGSVGAAVGLFLNRGSSEKSLRRSRS